MKMPKNLNFGNGESIYDVNNNYGDHNIMKTWHAMRRDIYGPVTVEIDTTTKLLTRRCCSNR